MSCDSPIVMNWNCERQGCFNRKKRLKFGVFKECLPGRISFTDVDGLVEINGNLLVLEWKEHKHTSTGQKLLYTRWTANGPVTVMLITGDAEDMTVDEVAIVYEGAVGPWQQMGLEGLKEEIREWADWASKNPARQRPQVAPCR